MRLFLLLLLIGTSVFVSAQERCATSGYLERKRQANSQEAKAMEDAAAFLKKQQLQKQVYEDAIFRIPVVVHVLYNNGTQNISDEQIRSGIEALNRDFRRLNADTVNTPQRFMALAADVQIEFYLAKADPLGRATSGILRKRTTRNGWLADDKIKLSAQGGDDAWDSKSYLNIWIGNLVGGSGYASVPGSAPATDGVVIHHEAFGTLNTATPFNMGRTAVHEVGHWLGLKHIWGDTQCGDDGVEDTPQQGFFTQGCPSDFRSSCNNGSAGDMYMNYMDYTNDACMNLFTDGQRSKMRAAFATGGPRSSLLQSKGLNEPWEVRAALATVAALYPNPASDKITVTVDNERVGEKLSFYNSHGQLVKVELVTSMQQSYNVAELKPGIYFLKGEGIFEKFIKL